MAAYCAIGYAAQLVCRDRFGWGGLRAGTLLTAALPVYLLAHCIMVLVLPPSPRPVLSSSGICKHIVVDSGLALLILIWSHRRLRRSIAKE